MISKYIFGEYGLPNSGRLRGEKAQRKAAINSRQNARQCRDNRKTAMATTCDDNNFATSSSSMQQQQPAARDANVGKPATTIKTACDRER